MEDLVTTSDHARDHESIRGVLAPIFRFAAHLPSWLVTKDTFPNSSVAGTPSTLQLVGRAGSWNKAGDRATSFLAAIVILAPVIALHFVHTSNQRLGAIAGFTMAFVLAMVTTSDVKRGEVFAATAAFGAVQVVYVGAALDQNTPRQ